MCRNQYLHPYDANTFVIETTLVPDLRKSAYSAGPLVREHHDPHALA